MPRRAPVARCPDPLHKGSRTIAKGTVQQRTGRVRRYYCEPLTGNGHYFSVGIAGGRRLRGQPGAPDCPDHPGAKIVRNGTYGTIAASRQRYRCDHTGRCIETCRQVCSLDHDGKPHAKTCAKACDGRHNFTPPLPREHVEPGHRCADCLELRGIHRGEQAVARRQRLAARDVARILNELSGGLSYAKAGRLAMEMLHNGMIPTVRRKPPATKPKPRVRSGIRPPRPHTSASRLANRFWHVGADITEAFAPVVWAETERRLRVRAEQMAYEGNDRVWILDDKPIYATSASGKRKKTDGWSVLVIAELDWTDRLNPGAMKLRLARALPKSTSTAWRLLFEEVGYVPDIIVSDAATPIIAAVETHFAARPPLFVPSIWHMKNALENTAFEKAIHGPNADAIGRHFADLRRDRALATPEAWSAWWDDLSALGGNLVVPADFARTREGYEVRMARAIPFLAADHRLKVSSGGLESTIRTVVEDILRQRAFQFANIERTNNLFDLAVARNQGMFIDLNAIARLIEADEMPHGGWTVPMRAIEDPQPRNDRYSSLRDEAQMRAVAAARGVA
jgi:hypothetical protein